MTGWRTVSLGNYYRPKTFALYFNLYENERDDKLDLPFRSKRWSNSFVVGSDRGDVEKYLRSKIKKEDKNNKEVVNVGSLIVLERSCGKVGIPERDSDGYRRISYIRRKDYFPVIFSCRILNCCVRNIESTSLPLPLGEREMKRRLSRYEDLRKESKFQMLRRTGLGYFIARKIHYEKLRLIFFVTKLDTSEEIDSSYFPQNTHIRYLRRLVESFTWLSQCCYYLNFLGESLEFCHESLRIIEKFSACSELELTGKSKYQPEIYKVILDIHILRKDYEESKKTIAILSEIYQVLKLSVPENLQEIKKHIMHGSIAEIGDHRLENVKDYQYFQKDLEDFLVWSKSNRRNDEDLRERIEFVFGLDEKENEGEAVGSFFSVVFPNKKIMKVRKFVMNLSTDTSV